MIEIEIEKLKPSQRFPDTEAYLHYSDAKRAGIRKGSQFTIDNGNEVFRAIDYVTWRPDINSGFSGFRCILEN